LKAKWIQEREREERRALKEERARARAEKRKQKREIEKWKREVSGVIELALYGPGGPAEGGPAGTAAGADKLTTWPWYGDSTEVPDPIRQLLREMSNVPPEKMRDLMQDLRAQYGQKMTDGMTRAFMGEHKPWGVVDEEYDTTGIESAQPAMYTSEKRDPRWGDGGEG
jgi:hypothetical protein